MKKKLAILLLTLLSMGIFAAPAARAIDLRIDLGDRPYYEGPTYWDSGYQFVWVAGHRRHGRWIHGHYERRGVFVREHAREHRLRHH